MSVVSNGRVNGRVVIVTGTVSSDVSLRLRARLNADQEIAISIVIRVLIPCRSDSLIDLPVAVVVQSIADFGRALMHRRI